MERKQGYPNELRHTIAFLCPFPWCRHTLPIVQAYSSHSVAILKVAVWTWVHLGYTLATPWVGLGYYLSDPYHCHLICPLADNNHIRVQSFSHRKQKSRCFTFVRVSLLSRFLSNTIRGIRVPIFLRNQYLSAYSACCRIDNSCSEKHFRAFRAFRVTFFCVICESRSDIQSPIGTSYKSQISNLKHYKYLIIKIRQ